MKCSNCIYKKYSCKENKEFYSCTATEPPTEITEEMFYKERFCGVFLSIPKEDVVNHPSHYTSGKVECIDCIESAMTPEQFCGFLRGNVIKYCFRCGKKDEEVQELKKAEWYLQKLIQFKEGQK